MKKSLLLFAALLFIACIATAQSQWVSYKIDDKLSANLPVQPTRADEHSVFVKGGDSIIYVVATVDFSKLEGHLDSAQLAEMAPTPEFTDELKAGMLSEMPGSTLGDVTPGKWNGYNTFSMEGGNAASKLKLYVYMVIIGTNMYSLMAIVPEGHETKGKDVFFASLALNN
ncbi:hypothetical protein [Mucilaginibacter ginsenosidivorans]|uniref:Uncharacterized protein n=1 Tax=Mucilaginibacter ginsenosidivorans TaxID=398053 RepID=A0A5B8UPT9_9SPHI|nr:hypothetical protein [Mucilaginibacter ginsenosidivorans]QEC61039.1 hypothetical protein FRZ54_00075 [Mucilaginibacter ginsenosidivorans]